MQPRRSGSRRRRRTRGLVWQPERRQESVPVQVKLNGDDITQSFEVRPNGQFEGLVTDLVEGPNELTATSPSGGAHVTITNHPKGGPVFAGPQVQPWPCTTQNHGLGPRRTRSTTTGNEVIDCKLLLHYFNDTSPHLRAVQAQRALVGGSQTGATCHAWVDVFRFDQSANPSQCGNTFTDCAVPAEQEYDPETNPDGVRCSVSDYQVAIWGRRDSDGFAKRPLDNVGIQYGLNALNSGLITPEQFVDLNEKIGGVDIDLNFQAARSEADPGSVTIAYRGAQVTSGHQLAKVPIIDLRGTSNNEIHTDFHTYEVRARLDRDAGGHANQIIWTNAGGLAGDANANREAFLLLDRWVSRIEADGSDDPLEVKVVRAKPADAVDACWIAGRRVTDMSTCRAAFPYYGSPRIAAGGPLTNDVMKCQTTPLARGDYSVSFTDAQRRPAAGARLADLRRRPRRRAAPTAADLGAAALAQNPSNSLLLSS